MNAIKTGIHQFIYTILAFPRAWRFIRHHKLWAGLKEYRWVYRFLWIVAILAGVFLIAEAVDWFEQHSNDNAGLLFGSDSLVADIGSETFSSFTDGSLKWVILILLEVVIYHFMRRTLQIVINKDVKDAHTFKPFLEAQKRMIAFSFMAYFLEVALADVGLGIFFGFFGFLKWASPAAVLFIQSGLLGLAIVDNYNEQFNLTLSQSFRYARMRYIGVCMGLGLPLFIMLKVPIIGTVFGPILTAVTAGIVMKELADLHTVGYIPSDKEVKKAEKKARKAERAAKRSNKKKAREEEEYWV